MDHQVVLNYGNNGGDQSHVNRIWKSVGDTLQRIAHSVLKLVFVADDVQGIRRSVLRAITAQARDG